MKRSVSKIIVYLNVCCDCIIYTNCDTLSNEEKVAAVVPVTSIEVKCSEAISASNHGTPAKC